jgi:predicted anti-sigma-YlaC factor YlaD
MSDTHIISTLEEKPFDSLTVDDAARIQSHIAVCDQCRSAYHAARIAASLVEARASEIVEVAPFFKTRVMAAVRERGLSPEEPSLLRMWRAAGALVSAFAILVVILAAMTIFVEGPESQIELRSQNLYSAEHVVLDRGNLGDDELATDQVVSTIYDLEDSDGQ